MDKTIKSYLKGVSEDDLYKWFYAVLEEINARKDKENEENTNGIH